MKIFSKSVSNNPFSELSLHENYFPNIFDESKWECTDSASRPCIPIFVFSNYLCYRTSHFDTVAGEKPATFFGSRVAMVRKMLDGNHPAIQQFSH